MDKATKTKATKAKATKAKTATFTFCDSGENHIGMEQLGKMVSVGEGFNKEDLNRVKDNLEKEGYVCELVDLRDLLEGEEKIGASEAFILVIRNIVGDILEKVGKSMEDFHKEVFREEIWDKKYWCTRRGRVLNKLARWNNVVSEVSREPNYEEKKGRIIGWNEVECLNEIKKCLERMIGDKAKGFVCEGNYYYDLKKTGIGFHGDAERRKVVAVRLGDSMSLCYNWYHYSKAIGEKKVFILNEGDMYMMSEKAVGTDWKKRSMKTLRHSAGLIDCKYVQTKK